MTNNIDGWRVMVEYKTEALEKQVAQMVITINGDSDQRKWQRKVNEAVRIGGRWKHLKEP